MLQIQFLLGLRPTPNLGSSERSPLLRRRKCGDGRMRKGEGRDEREGRGKDPKGLVHTAMSEILKIGLP